MLALFREWLRTPDRLRLNVCSHQATGSRFIPLACAMQTTCVRFETRDVHDLTAADPAHALLRLQVT